MKVKLIAYTPEPEILSTLAARTCYSDKRTEELRKEVKKADPKKFLRKIITSGHHSTLEHASFSFSAENVSRVLLAQLTRHRIASYSVQSQRYVRFDEKFDYIIPPTINSSQKLKEEFIKIVERSRKTYAKLLKNGVPPEDARFILPQCSSTKLIFTMNARELLHFFKLRLCNRAQWEINELARKMLKEVKKVAPNIFHYAGPNCRIDRCKEEKPCKNPWPKIKL